MALKIKNAKTIQKKSLGNVVKWLGENHYEVVSGTSGNVYTVEILDDGGTCTCDWAKYRSWRDPRSACSHVLAAIREAVIHNGSKGISAWTNEEDASRQHRTTFDIGDGVLLTLRNS